MLGDLAIFLITKGVKPEDMVNLPPETGFPESVIDLLSGNLGQPLGGWPKEVQKVVLGKQKPMRGRPGASAPKIDLKKEFSKLQKKIGRKATEDDLFAHLMYPQVFQDYLGFRVKYGDVSVLPTTSYFHGLSIGEEISIEIEEGKTLLSNFLISGSQMIKGSVP